MFTNLNPTRPRVWQTTSTFEHLAEQYAREAGLKSIADGESALNRTLQNWGQKLGIRGMGRTAYDKFMLRFHDYLKENTAFQQGCPKIRLEFPPLSTWIVYTDGVAHAAMEGQYALEQTFLIPSSALCCPGPSPLSHPRTNSRSSADRLR